MRKEGEGYDDSEILSDSRKISGAWDGLVPMTTVAPKASDVSTRTLSPLETNAASV